MKSEVLDAIGEVDLRRAAMVNAALAANDRAKFLFSLLQMAVSRAAHPDQAAADLRRERVACGIDDASLDAVVPGARALGERVLIPDGRAVLARLGVRSRSWRPRSRAAPSTHGWRPCWWRCRRPRTIWSRPPPSRR